MSRCKAKVLTVVDPMGVCVSMKKISRREQGTCWETYTRRWRIGQGNCENRLMSYTVDARIRETACDSVTGETG